MTLRRLLFLLLTHALALGAGFAAGLYTLPILTAPPAPDAATVASAAADARFSGTFSRDRADSDALHWGDGEISIGSEQIAFAGRLAPGPDYRLYLSPEFVETEADFERLRARMVRVGDVRSFDGFVLPLADGIDPADYSAVIVWCESFGEFITSAAYGPPGGA